MIKLKNLIFEGITERNTYVASSKIPGAGKGLFAAKDLKAGELILTAPIQHIPDDQWRLLVDDAPELIMRYGYSWGGQHYGVPGKWAPGFRLSPEAKEAISKTIFNRGFHEFNFMNDDQNNYNVFNERIDPHGIKVFARRNIKKGEELTRHYPWHGTATYKKDSRQFDWWK